MLSKLNFEAHIIAKLEQIRLKQLQVPYPDPYLQTYNVVLITSFLGGIFLTLDGQIIYVDYLEEELNPKPVYGKEFTSALVLAARNFMMPELLQFLPARPNQTLDCDVCLGKGWISNTSVKGENSKKNEKICYVCGALGWIANK